MRNNSVNFFRPVVKEEMPFKCISYLELILSSGSPFVQLSKPFVQFWLAVL